MVTVSIVPATHGAEAGGFHELGIWGSAWVTQQDSILGKEKIRIELWTVIFKNFLNLILKFYKWAEDSGQW